MIKLRFLLIQYPLWLSFLLLGCPVYDPPSGQLEILNYTDSAVYVYHTCSDSLPCDYGMKLFLSAGGGTDASGRTMKDTIAPSYRINAYSWGNITGLGAIEKPVTACRDHKLRLYFIKETTMRTKTWEEICQSELYEKKITLTQQELDSMGWRLAYEPEIN